MASPFTLSSFRGGLNTYDPPTALQPDQVVVATNVELVDAPCGGRRLGHTNLALGAGMAATTGVWKMHRHLPTADESLSQLWALSGTAGSAAQLNWRTGAVWNIETIIDTPDLTAVALSSYQFLSLHGKLYIAYPCPTDRLHVWGGLTGLLRAGLGTPAAPTAANVGVGTLAGVRYYRVRYINKSGTTVVRRSEPSNALSFSPSGAGTTVRVTRPALLSESETHWELEASLDNANFYVLATTIIATTTFDDLTPYASGYTSGLLSEDIGEYTVIPSGKFLLADNDRLIMGGSWGNADYASRIVWTPTLLSPGVGNDERLALGTDPRLDLDGYQGGEITGLVSSGGVIYAFKQSHIYRLVHTGQASQAYEAVNISKSIGAIPGSIIAGLDPSGNPAVFFIDERVGPCMIGNVGIIQIGLDIKRLWDGRVTTASVDFRVRGCFYPSKRQVRWAFTESGSTNTTLGLWLHVNEMQFTSGGGRRGWTTITGTSVQNVSDMILYADNVASGLARSSNLIPMVSRFDASGNQHHILIGESGTTDDVTAYAAVIQSRPVMFGGGINRFGVRAASLVATAAPGVTIDMTLTRDFGKETKPVAGISLAAVAGESYVMPEIDNIFMSEARAIDVKIADSSPATGTWKLDQITLVPSNGQSS